MKVLLAGPWDLAGRYTAERFLQEGHSVCWFTREPQRRLWDHRLQGTVCRGAFTRESILQVLRAHRIDTVIFLTGALREETGPRPENPARDLDELLAALQNHPVEHFVYLSSMELSWGNALTPRQAALAAGELSCRAGRDHGKLPLLIIRLAYLYGRAAPEDMGLMGSMLQAIREGRTIRCPYHPQDCIDMMHAADAARGIYRMILHGMQGTQLLASGYPLPIKTVCRCLEQAAGGTARVEWLGQRHTMPAECFDGRAVKTETGWMPYTLLQDSGWQLIREETLPSRPAAPAKERQPSRLGPLLRRMGETLVLFVITLGLLQFGKDVSDLKYVDIRLMFVAVTACCYGGGAGLLAVVLASLSYLYELASSYVDVSYLLYSVDTCRCCARPWTMRTARLPTMPVWPLWNCGARSSSSWTMPRPGGAGIPGPRLPAPPHSAGAAAGAHRPGPAAVQPVPGPVPGQRAGHPGPDDPVRGGQKRRRPAGASKLPAPPPGAAYGPDSGLGTGFWKRGIP